MNKNIFLSRLKHSYDSQYHIQRLKNVTNAINSIDPFLEPNFYTNHFNDFFFSDGKIQPTAYTKYHQGLWHLHIASYFNSLGYKLIKPQTEEVTGIIYGSVGEARYCQPDIPLIFQQPGSKQEMILTSSKTYKIIFIKSNKDR